MNYELIAIDIDGTLLDENKQLSPENRHAVNLALSRGKHVAICSGRCMAELQDFVTFFPQMRFFITENGARLYDRKENAFLYSEFLGPDNVEYIREVVKGRDIMPQIMMGLENVLPAKHRDNLDHFYMGQYKSHYDRSSKYVEDPFEYCKENDWKTCKISLYHTDEAEREKTIAALSHLPLSMVYSEITSAEITSFGIDKGRGLSFLCHNLGIPAEKSIAIGDYYNDIGMLQVAGLPIAMENAVKDVKEISRTTVADCNHSGVAEAIRKFIL